MRGADLAGDVEGFIQVVWTPFVQRWAIQQFHDDERARRAIFADGFAGVVDGDDVGMVEAGDGAGLTHEAGTTFASQAGR
jgi:hypothetical protein